MRLQEEALEQIDLNAYEVLAIAVQVERNGIEFYRKAAGLFHESPAGELFNQLLQWEEAHADSFSKMMDESASRSWQRGTYSPHRVIIPESKILAGLAVFGIQPDPREHFTGKETREEVLRVAINKEKDAVVFYTGLKGFVSDPDDQATLDEVIREEMHHVRVLSQALEQSSAEEVPGDVS
jgi:rubrerythrin